VIVAAHPPLGLGQDERGAAIAEFAMILVPLCLLIFGGLDMGYQIYVRSVTLGALERASRLTTLQTVDSTAVEADIETQIKRIVPNATVTTTKGSFYQYSNINALERLTIDANGNNVLNSGDCYEDVDNSSTRNTVTTGKTGIGGADDIVRYNTVVTYPRFIPIYRFIGIGNSVTMTATTLMRRQPYEVQGTPPVRCMA
jgi:Flp pilus assembly protein TadG